MSESIKSLTCNHPAMSPKSVICAAVAIIALWSGEARAEERWRGLTVAPEYRCAPYSRDDYRYPRSVEPKIVSSMGGLIYGPYTGRQFASMRETDIEHMVAVSEAHDSGLCAADPTTRRRFAADQLNLTLAAPAVNRCGRGGKCAHDAAEWLPPMNRCWFAARVVAVKRKYHLSVDRGEADALERVLSECTSVDMIVATDGTALPSIRSRSPSSTQTDQSVDALGLWDDNGNGRITCSEARRHGIAPVPRSHPAYRFMRDGDGDGEVCE